MLAKRGWEVSLYDFRPGNLRHPDFMIFDANLDYQILAFLRPKPLLSSARSISPSPIVE